MGTSLNVNGSYDKYKIVQRFYLKKAQEIYYFFYNLIKI